MRAMVALALALLVVCATVNLAMHASTGAMHDDASNVDISPFLRRPLQHGSASAIQEQGRQSIRLLTQQQHDASAWPPFPFANQSKYQLYHVPTVDQSPRCKRSGICDGNHTCGSDGLGCITDAAARLEKIRQATKWSWAGYRWVMWWAHLHNASSQKLRSAHAAIDSRAVDVPELYMLSMQ